MSDSPEPYIPPDSPVPNEDEEKEAPQLPSNAKIPQTFYAPWQNPMGWNTPYSPWSPWGPPISAYAYTPWSPWSPLPPVIVRSQPTLSIHRHLCHNVHNPTASPELLWDIIHPPEFARVSDARLGRYSWQKPDFDADALQPSVKKVWIVSDHPVLGFWFRRWGRIAISSDKVTVGGVLWAIYQYLRNPLSSEDLDLLGSLPGNREGLCLAREKRARESYEIDSVVLSSPYRRVDVVGTHRRFQGLRIVIAEDDTWRLQFNLSPGPVPRIP